MSEENQARKGAALVGLLMVCLGVAIKAVVTKGLYPDLEVPFWYESGLFVGVAFLAIGVFFLLIAWLAKDVVISVGSDEEDVPEDGDLDNADWWKGG